MIDLDIFMHLVCPALLLASPSFASVDLLEPCNFLTLLFCMIHVTLQIWWINVTLHPNSQGSFRLTMTKVWGLIKPKQDHKHLLSSIFDQEPFLKWVWRTLLQLSFSWYICEEELFSLAQLLCSAQPLKVWLLLGRVWVVSSHSDFCSGKSYDGDYTTPSSMLGSTNQGPVTSVPRLWCL